MTEPQRAFIASIEEDLAKTAPFERAGFEPGHRPTAAEIDSLTEQTCKGIRQCLPEGKKRDALLSQVRLAAETALTTVNPPYKPARPAGQAASPDKPSSAPVFSAPVAGKNYIEIAGRLCLRCSALSPLDAPACKQCGRSFTAVGEASGERESRPAPPRQIPSKNSPPTGTIRIDSPRAAIWRSREGDVPVVVTAYAGRHQGLDYVYTEGSGAALPYAEIVFDGAATVRASQPAPASVKKTPVGERPFATPKTRETADTPTVVVTHNPPTYPTAAKAPLPQETPREKAPSAPPTGSGAKTAQTPSPSINKEVMGCPQCGQNLSVPRDKGAITVTCPKCRYSFVYPEASKPPAGNSLLSKLGRFGDMTYKVVVYGFVGLMAIGLLWNLLRLLF